ncbi:MAG TPA: hypothetical protein PL045_00575 [Chitinophagaceae bacterium]|nr:hypothetical protein [Chitinophagaceae bacterium]
MNNNSVSRIAQIVFALTMLVFAFFHLSNADAMAGGVPAFMPGGGTLWVYVSGVCLALAALAFILNMKVKLAGYLLGLLLLIIALTVHLPHLLSGDEMEMGQILKDTGLAAAAFFIGSKGA